MLPPISFRFCCWRLNVCVRNCSGHFTQSSDGRGQVVENNMADDSAYITTMTRYHLRFPLWDSQPGRNLLDDGCPWYDMYGECKGGDYMAVGTLEPKFFVELLRGLAIGEELLRRREDRSTWLEMRKAFRPRFLDKRELNGKQHSVAKTLAVRLFLVKQNYRPTASCRGCRST